MGTGGLDLLYNVSKNSTVLRADFFIHYIFGGVVVCALQPFLIGLLEFLQPPLSEISVSDAPYPRLETFYKHSKPTVDLYFRPDVDQQPQVPQTNHAPAMMTFKQFLNAQDDNISDEDAFKKYQEYKLEFRKTQMSDFFQQHKEEEWYVVT